MDRRNFIKAMLETGDLTGKCADLNALFVGLARASGRPARDVYGIRVADSRFGYKSLGKSGEITRAQHCRAEVWLSGSAGAPIPFLMYPQAEHAAGRLDSLDPEHFRYKITSREITL